MLSSFSYKLVGIEYILVLRNTYLMTFLMHLYLWCMGKGKLVAMVFGLELGHSLTCVGSELNSYTLVLFNL